MANDSLYDPRLDPYSPQYDPTYAEEFYNEMVAAESESAGSGGAGGGGDMASAALPALGAGYIANQAWNSGPATATGGGDSGFSLSSLIPDKPSWLPEWLGGTPSTAAAPAAAAAAPAAYDLAATTPSLFSNAAIGQTAVPGMYDLASSMPAAYDAAMGAPELAAAANYDLTGSTPMFSGAADAYQAAAPEASSFLSGVTPYLGAAATALGAYNLYNQMKGDAPGRPAGSGMFQGALAGGGIGAGLGMMGLGALSTLGPIGLGLGGAAGLIHAMTGSSKGKDQLYRDEIRKWMKENKIIDDNYNLTFSDGHTWDVGKDGGFKLTNAGTNIDGRNDRSAFEVDFSRGGEGEVIGSINPLVAIMTDGKMNDINMAGYFTNALQAGKGDKKGYARELYNKFGLDHDTAYGEIMRLQAEGKISEQDANAFKNGLDETFQTGAYRNKNTPASQAPSAFNTTNAASTGGNKPQGTQIGNSGAVTKMAVDRTGREFGGNRQGGTNGWIPVKQNPSRTGEALGEVPGVPRLINPKPDERRGFDYMEDRGVRGGEVIPKKQSPRGFDYMQDRGVRKVDLETLRRLYR